MNEADGAVAVVLRGERAVFDAPEDGSAPSTHLAVGAPVRARPAGDGWLRLTGVTVGGYMRASDVAKGEPPDGARYLAGDAGLREVRLEPVSSQRIAIGDSASPVERAVAVAWNRYGGLVAVLADRAGIDPGGMIAVVCVEASGLGFGADGRVVIRFENHIFRRQLPATRHPEFARHFGITGDQPWLGHVFRASEADAWQPFHGSQEREWRVLEFALGMDERAALRSISMGLGQIMGFNHAEIGYRQPQSMLAFFQADARYQVLSMFDFVGGARTDAPALRALRAGDYPRFASMYNGPGQARYYGDLIATHVEAFRRLRMHRGGTAGTDAGWESGRSYRVRPGDTLSALAARFGVTVSDLVRTNRITNPDLIFADQSLSIPATPSPVAVPSVPPDDLATAADGTTASRTVYVIQPGDTLSAIAARHGRSVEALAAVNGIADPDRIFAGQAIAIP